MKLRIIIFLLLSIAASFPIKAQKLNIGDKCPDILLRSLLNHQRKKGNLVTDFNNKPLIIDFWFSNCGPCLEFIPKLDTLQKSYHNEFNILCATLDNEETVKKTFTKNVNLSKTKLPIATNIETTSDLLKLFPHTMEPHEIWIGKDGIIKAISSHYYVTPSNIEKFINNQPLNIPEKKEITDPKIAGKPLLLVDNEYSGGKGKLYYLYIGKADPQLPGISKVSFDKTTGEGRILCQNCPVHTMYEVAYKRRGVHTPMKVTNKYKDSTKFIPDILTMKGIYCFEVIIKDTSEVKAQQLMKRELDNFFGLKSSLTQELVPCYVLSSTKTTERFKSKDKDDTNSSHDIEGNNIIVKNIGIYAVMRNRLYNNLPYNVINETGYDGIVNLVVPHSTDINQLKKSLNQYGLDLNLEMRNEERIILEDM
ncbi:TlpA family protein disulfide reductase [Chitinophaga qingshengii]|uniref:Thioredoxin domain-containing protein n=1 Tax=Chitinophaga qingshengii TaxID=1569794 RepID=A0ABR7TI88_9BACT|nr:thioredoxin-like domain-containing protein [Chitinophaga qingshengii]MBC9929099.1 hypothetical protein [Chitinophaga qingshengii]